MPVYNNTSGNNYQTSAGIFGAGITGFSTVEILDHLPGIVRVDDQPSFNWLRDRHDQAFTGSGQVTVSFAAPHLIKSILITATVDLDMHINRADNDPPKKLLAGKEYFLIPNGMVDGLVFDHQSDGSVTVEEVGPLTEESSSGGGVTFGGNSVTFGGEGVDW